jgi:hypothetical protein
MRALVPKIINKNDIVLEAGCAGGVTTAKIGQFALEAHGLDYNTSKRV